VNFESGVAGCSDSTPEEIRACAIWATTESASRDCDWVTPRPLVELAVQVMGGIDLDPASSNFAQRNVRAAEYYTPARDGLSLPWFGRVWLCPPNGRASMPAFTAKLIHEYCAGRVVEAVALVPNAGDTRWFHRLAGLRFPVCYVRGRINFESHSGKKSTPPNGHSVFYLGNRQDVFKNVFSHIGRVWISEEDSSEMAAVCAADRAKIASRALAPQA